MDAATAIGKNRSPSVGLEALDAATAAGENPLDPRSKSRSPVEGRGRSPASLPALPPEKVAFTLFAAEAAQKEIRSAFNNLPPLIRFNEVGGSTRGGFYEPAQNNFGSLDMQSTLLGSSLQNMYDGVGAGGGAAWMGGGGAPRRFPAPQMPEECPAPPCHPGAGRQDSYPVSQFSGGEQPFCGGEGGGPQELAQRGVAECMGAAGAGGSNVVSQAQQHPWVAMASGGPVGVEHQMEHQMARMQPASPPDMARQPAPLRSGGPMGYGGDTVQSSIMPMMSSDGGGGSRWPFSAGGVQYPKMYEQVKGRDSWLAPP